jgi:hypothetical protein
MLKLLKPSDAKLIIVFASACVFSGPVFSDSGADAAKQGNSAMKSDEPMPAKMAKPGMKTGDVKKRAREHDQRMKPMLDKEEKGMKGR